MTILRKLSMTDYHRSDAISHSKLRIFRRSPLLYFKRFIERSIEDEKTRALVVGDATDCHLFDGLDVYATRFVVQPETYLNDDGESKSWNGNATYCKQWKRSQVMLGKIILTADENALCNRISSEVRRHPLAAALLSQGEPQVTFRRDSERFGLSVQVRPDWVSMEPICRPDLGLDSFGRPYMADLKTTEDLDDWFDVLDPEDTLGGKTVAKWLYHRQGGMAQWCAFQDIGQTAHYLIIAEKSEPCRVAVVQLSDDFLDIGWQQTEADLKRLAACKVANVWPGSPERVITIHPPEWLQNKAMRETVTVMDRAAS